MRRATMVLVVAILASGLAWADDGAPMHVMVVNDDGVDAPGLEALVAVLAADPGYRITVVAPAEHQSGMGHSLILRGEIPVSPHAAIHGAPAWAVGATPATTSRVGVSLVLADDPPELVVSGINRGENVGRIAWYSGTVGAAREAVLAGVPAIALSLQLDWTDPKPDFAAAARWAKPVIDAVRRTPLPEGVLLNVNLPKSPTTTRGYRVARMGLAADLVAGFEVVRTDGAVRYLKAIWSPAREDEPGTDNEALVRGWVAIAPLGLDQTDFRAIPALQDLNSLAPPAELPAEAAAAAR
jgi:5'-nucleotidase